MKEKLEDKSLRCKTDWGLTVISEPGDEFYDKMMKLKEDGRPLIISKEDFFKGIPEFKTKAGWSPQIGISKTMDKVNNIIVPKMPKGFEGEYDFPNTSDISLPELGNWLIKIASWKGYVLRLLSKADIERIILDSAYDTSISKKYAQLTKESNKVTKDLATGILLEENESFKDLRIRLIEKNAEVQSLKHIIEIYTAQIDAISREISRRAMEVKFTGVGLG